MLNKYFSVFIYNLQNTDFSWIVSRGFSILLIILLTVALIWIIDRVTKKIILRHIHKTKDSPLYEKKRAETLTRTLKNTIKATTIAISFIMILGQLGVDTTAIVASAGLAAAAIGFGAQSLIKDVISGFFILAENQYRVGDYVTVANLYGKVEEVGLRTTVVKGEDGVVHYIPNGQILLASNFSRSRSGIYLDVSVSPKSNLGKAVEIINEVGLKMTKDKKVKDDILTAPYFVRIENFSTEGVVLMIKGETKSGMQWYISGEFRKRLFEEFKKHKIQLGDLSQRRVKSFENQIRRFN